MKAIWRPRFTNMGVRIILVLSIAISASPAAFGDEAWIQKELLAPQPMRAKKFWGPATEGLRAGVQVGYYSHKDFEYFSAGRDAIPIRLFPLMTYNGTNFGRLHSDFLDLDLPM
jgi:hypothetical protein